MVAKIITGKNMKGVLHYNEHKVQEGKAKLLLAHRFLQEPHMLSFQQKLERFGQLVERTLRQFAIREMEDPQQKERLLRSLERGNAQQVTALQDGQETKRFIEANPRYKTINVFDEQLKPVKRETLLKQEPQQAQRKETKQELLAEDRQELKPARRKGLAM